MNFKKRIAVIATTATCAFSCMSIGTLNFSFVNAAELSGRTAFQITSEMKVGWNLGNSFDSISASSDPSVQDSETAWGNPVTTKAMIDEVKKKGFNTVRIPTTWFQHVDSNFTIESEWLARVKEVVDYCYDNDMYVILNIHHEEWINRSDFDEAYDDMSSKLTTLWKQIAQYFGDYDQHLIFEGMNEPRAAGTDREWWGATEKDKDVINKLNADFVKTVRSVDSKYNSSRLLMIPSYCASSDSSIYSSLVVPDDDHIAVSVHAYSPYSFTMNEESDHDEFTSAYEAELDSILSGVRTTFISNNIPVVIGEMSASNYHNTSAREKWAESYATLAKKYGFPIVLWDNNVDVNPDPAEAHGYLNRAQLTWYTESSSVADALINTYNSDSVKFGEEGIAPVYTHADINSGKILSSDTYVLDGADENKRFTANFKFDWSMVEGKEIAVQFTGTAPKAAMMDGNWENWTDPDPYEVKDGIAYYSAESLKAKWSASTTPADIRFGIYSGNTVVTKIAIIDAATKKEAGAIEIGTPVEPPTEETTEEPTKPTEEPTNEPTQPTDEPTQPTDEPTQPTDEPTQPTDEPTQPTDEPTQPTGEDNTVPEKNPDETYIYGDVNLDGKVNSADVTRLSKYLLNKNIYQLGNGDEATKNKALIQSDVANDNKINNADVSKLVNFALGSIGESNLGPQ